MNTDAYRGTSAPSSTRDGARTGQSACGHSDPFLNTLVFTERVGNFVYQSVMSCGLFAFYERVDRPEKELDRPEAFALYDENKFSLRRIPR